LSAAVVAFGAVSALGEGAAAASVGALGGRAEVAIARDVELERAGLVRPFAARVARRIDERDDRATALLTRALEQCVASLASQGDGLATRRIGVVLGTSSGGMRSAEVVFDAVASGRAPSPGELARATYFAPMEDALRRLGIEASPCSLVLGACASSTLALGLAARFLEDGACDVVLAGGFDAVSVFVAAGFEALRATSGVVPPRPFRLARDGMALGEGAAVLALVRPDDARVPPLAYLAGFGASTDAVHLTAPDRDGNGVVRAARRAMAQALGDAREGGRDGRRDGRRAGDRAAAGDGPTEATRRAIGLVSAHASATPFNDAAESCAIGRLFGDPRAPVVHPFKAQIGHTLGAAGALESLACIDAMARSVLPASAGEGELDPAAPATLLAENTRGDVTMALKLSAAFGGANAALVWSRRAPNADARGATMRNARVVAATHAAASAADEAFADALAEAVAIPADRLLRADGLTRLALSAVASLRRDVGPLDGAGIVVGHAFATMETNVAFHRGMRARGARFAEPRRFPYTSPNAVAGECAIAFGLTGPSFAVSSGLHGGLEALVLATTLIRAGDADRIVVLAVDEVGDVSSRVYGAIAGEAAAPLGSGAVALLVEAACGAAREDATSSGPRVGRLRIARATLTGPRAKVSAVVAPGHTGLLPLVASASMARPCELVSSSPSGEARVFLVPEGGDNSAR
jgi:3-oxoacyl-[acyl-carrier-protein] synthase-1/3-oxoacyl-[acyl-carrier-protein] synthase II